MGDYAAKRDKQLAAQNERHMSRYCCVNGCKNLGTMSHAAAGWDHDGKGRGHQWYCPDHFVAPEVPAYQVPLRTYPIASQELERQELEQRYRAHMRAELGPGALPYEEEQWWRSRYRTLAQEFSRNVGRTGRS